MTLTDAIKALDECIPHPSNKMVDGEHLNIAVAWLAIKEELHKGCDTCKWRNTDNYKYYTYPCDECKYSSRDSYEFEG